jgi:TolA-binding protein
MKMTRGLALLLLAATPALAQTSPDEQARRLLEDGRAYWAQGKLKQALDNFTTIASGFSNTTSVDDALLEIGRYHAEVEGDLAKARGSFEEVTKRYPQSDGAPGAYYQLGQMALKAAVGPAELDDALAQFDRVPRLYPRSEWVPRALYAAGLVHRRAGRLAEAAEAERRVAFEYPASDVAAAAQFQVGHDLGLLGDAAAAMEEFQQVRNRYPQSEWAAAALDRITALYRLKGIGAPGFTVDPAYAVGAGDVVKDVRALALDGQRTLWIASDKANAAVPYAADGRMGASLAGQDLRSLSLGPNGEIVVTSRLAARIGSRDVRSFTVPNDKGVPEPLEKLTAAVLLPGGSMLVADEKHKKVFRCEQGPLCKATFPDAREHEITRLLLDGEGAIVALDREARTVQVFDRNGALLRTIGPRSAGYDFKKPTDVAVDAFRNVYVADEDVGVYVLSPTGQYLATLAGEAVRKPKAIAVEPSGAVLVYDEKTQRVVRFR